MIMWVKGVHDYGKVIASASAKDGPGSSTKQIWEVSQRPQPGLLLRSFD